MTEPPEIMVRVPGWQMPWLVHGFSTRRGGVSTVYLPNSSPQGDDASAGDRGGELNLGWNKDDSPENVGENRRRLVAAVAGSPEGAQSLPLITIRQIHSANSLVVRAPEVEPLSSFVTPEGRALRDADGLITQTSGLLLGIQTADCVPVFVVD